MKSHMKYIYYNRIYDGAGKSKYIGMYGMQYLVYVHTVCRIGTLCTYVLTLPISGLSLCTSWRSDNIWSTWQHDSMQTTWQQHDSIKACQILISYIFWLVWLRSSTNFIILKSQKWKHILCTYSSLYSQLCPFLHTFNFLSWSTHRPFFWQIKTSEFKKITF